MSKETNKDSLINFAKELDKLNDVNITLKGNIEAILYDPLVGAEEQAVNAIGQNLERLVEARELGKQFMEEINGV